MPAQYRARLIHDIAGPRRAGPQAVDDRGVAPFRHKADILAVRLGGIDQPQGGGDAAYRALVHIAQGATQIVELCPGGSEQKIALGAAAVGSSAKLRAMDALPAA